MPSLKQLQSALEPHLGERTEVVLKEGLARLGLTEGDLSDADTANLLKRIVYRELQREMDAAGARKVVKDVLAGLAGGEQPGAEPDPQSKLQAALSRYSLYFEWPEVQRLRSLAALIEASESEGQSASDLLKEAEAQIDLLDEKLQNSLLRQARDISDLEGALERVKSIGGPKLRRLQSLLKQIKEAQASDTLATAEVERARKLAADMRKLVESSVVQNPTLVPEAVEPEENGVIAVEEDEEPEMAVEEEGFELLIDFESLEPEVADRIREIDLAEERRRLELLKEQFAAVWNTEGVSGLAQEVEQLLDGGELAGEKLNQLQLALDDAIKDALAEARARYEWLSERLRSLDLEGGLATGRARSQLELIKESLDMGVLPGDLEEAERQIRSLEEALVKRRAEEARRARTIEEASSLVANAHEALNGEELPELAGFRERLALLEAGLAAGDVDEALLARLKTELPEALNQIALAGEATKALRARLIAELESLPPLEELKPTIETLRLQVEELPPEEFEAAVADLRQQARVLSQTTLRELAEEARRFQVPTGAVEEALTQLDGDQLPDLEQIKREVEAAIAAKREEAKQELEGLAAAARRLEGMGGEALLPEIEAALAKLDQELPELGPLQEKLSLLTEKREALRSKLDRRYREIRERYDRASTVGGETAYRTQTLLNFLEKGADRLSRLGTSGLQEFERALGEAEKLIQQLEEEYAAAKQVAQQLQGADLDDLLGVFETPAVTATEAPPAAGPQQEGEGSEAEVLAPFRIRGVLWAHKLAAGTPVPADVDADLVRALAEDLELLREEVGAAKTRTTVITLTDHVLLISPLSDGLAVILAEKALLSRLVSLADRHLKEAS